MATLLYLGTEEGVLALRSDDGKSWTVTSHALKRWEIPEVAVLSSAPNRVFAATRGDGVWRSEDFGVTWSKPCYGKPGPGKVRCLTFHPRDPEVLYAGCEPIDVYVTEDLGRTWIRLESIWKIPAVETIDYPVPTVEPHVRDIAIDTTDPRKIYAALQVGYIARSTDSGRSWTLLDRDLDADVHTIVIDPVDPTHIVVATGGHDCRAGRAKGRALYMSQDGGESWLPVGTNFRQEYAVPLVMHPRNPHILYAALANGNPGEWRRPTGAESVVVRTQDGGHTWEKIEKGVSGLSADFVTAIAFDESDPDHVYAALRSGGLIASDDGGESWMKLDVKVPPVTDMKCVQT